MMIITLMKPTSFITSRMNVNVHNNAHFNKSPQDTLDEVVEDKLLKLLLLIKDVSTSTPTSRKSDIDLL